MGENGDFLFWNKLELEYNLRFPKAANGNGNKVMGMGGNGYTSHSRTSLVGTVNQLRHKLSLRITASNVGAL